MEVGVISVRLKSAPRERKNDEQKVKRHDATRVIEETEIEVS